MRLTTEEGLQLHGDLQRPAGVPIAAAVVCHPHPQYGGTSEAWLVPLVQGVFVDAGWAALRFDFRGAGRSEGGFDHGVGEQTDVAAAVAFVRAEIGGDVPLLVGGWSFGAAVSLRHVLDDPDVDGWFGIALPAPGPDIPETTADEVAADDRPLLFVHGGQDQVAPIDGARALADAAPAGELVVVEEADHFFAKGAGQLRGAVRDFAERFAAT